MKTKNPYDYYLIIATTIVLFVISVLCIYGMFYFKMSQIQQMPAAMKVAYMERMNTLMAPFLVALVLLLGICVPKRLLPTAWLNRFAVLLLALAVAAGLMWSLRHGLILILASSLVLQLVVLVLATAGSTRLRFERKGYVVRVGSSLLHLGIILFVFDLFFYRSPGLHLVLFWTMTLATVAGMLFCFYAEKVIKFFGKRLP